MSMFPNRRDDDRKPNPRKAQADLERTRARRVDVDALVDALTRERHLNNFTANVTITFRGGRA